MKCRTAQRTSSFTALLTVLTGIIAGFVLLAAVVLNTGCAAAPAPVTLTPEIRDAYARSFDQVWNTVKEKHWDPTLAGVDWDRARSELRPAVESAATADDARSVLNQLLGRLGMSHYGIIAAEAYSRLSAERDSPNRGNADTGITVRIIDSRAVVWRVRQGSPAERAGVAPGWIITSVAGRSTDQAIAAVGAALKKSTETEFSTTSVVQSRLRGSAGSTLSLTLLDANDREVSIDLTLEPAPGEPVQLGNLPSTTVTFEARELDGQVGYFTFSPFLAPSYIMPRIEQFVTSKPWRGIIIDLRGNPGGMIPMTSGIAGFIVTEPSTKLGKMVTRDNTLNLSVNPRVGAYRGPVAVIVDACSVSSSEILAAGLQDIGRARVFGSRSAGACLPSVVEKLPSGDGFQYAFADYISAGGESLEGRGVIPDESVPVTRAALLGGRDEPLERARMWIVSSTGASN